jgi:hypothetical protein
MQLIVAINNRRESMLGQGMWVIASQPKVLKKRALPV